MESNPQHWWSNDRCRKQSRSPFFSLLLALACSCPQAIPTKQALKSHLPPPRRRIVWHLLQCVQPPRQSQLAHLVATPTSTTTLAPSQTPTAVIAVPAPTNTPLPRATFAAAETSTPPSAATAQPPRPGLTLPSPTATPLGVGVVPSTATPLSIAIQSPTPTPQGLTGPDIPYPDLEITALEVTQGIQNLDNDMPLVARQDHIRPRLRSHPGRKPRQRRGRSAGKTERTATESQCSVPSQRPDHGGNDRW